MAVEPELLARAYAEAAEHWPGVNLGRDAFEKIATEWTARTGKPLAEANVRDLYIAAAIGEGSPAAPAAFDKAFLLRAEPSLRKLNLPPAAIADVLQDRSGTALGRGVRRTARDCRSRRRR